ncbi:MAG: hypothetical protein QF415_07095 [Candidatus Undinarchaeales archaeon]|jgi:glycine cleavage system H protein|nr:hypothetical protein [Candidatus Undinarchaeales archaeon]MDP7494035.1 hypothetical protein [Candidatus Undinarchaeales archaeon]
MDVDGYDYPMDLHYSKDHVWVRTEGECVRIEFTDFAQDIAGGLHYVRVFPAGKRIETGRAQGTVGTGKWVGPVVAPVSGTVVEPNERLACEPGLVNSDPFGDGWFAIVAPDNLDDGLRGLVRGDEPSFEGWMKERMNATRGEAHT